VSGSAAFPWRYYRVIGKFAFGHAGVFGLIEIFGHHFQSQVSVIGLIFIIGVFDLIL
jgi:hypothetical protein